MAATFILLLSCFVYGVVACPPSSSYLPPGGAVVRRPAVQGSVAPEVISGPSVAYLPLSKRRVSGRPAVQASGF